MQSSNSSYLVAIDLNSYFERVKLMLSYKIRELSHFVNTLTSNKQRLLSFDDFP